MSKTALNECLSEILKDENGNEITPNCGIEKFLSELCNCIPEPITAEEIDKITSQ